MTPSWCWRTTGRVCAPSFASRNPKLCRAPSKRFQPAPSRVSRKFTNRSFSFARAAVIVREPMSADFSRLPPSQPPVFDRGRAERFVAELAALWPAVADNASFRALLESVAGNSPYLARSMLQESAFLLELSKQGPYEALAELEEEALAVAGDTDDAAVMRRLRIAKRRAALVIALSDIGAVYDLESVTEALTRFAGACVKGALRFLLAEAHRRENRTAADPDLLERTTGLIVIAMGKLGAFELNYSSDIDLVVFYDEERFPFTRSGDKRVAAVDLVKGLLK